MRETSLIQDGTICYVDMKCSDNGMYKRRPCVVVNCNNFIFEDNTYRVYVVPLTSSREPKNNIEHKFTLRGKVSVTVIDESTSVPFTAIKTIVGCINDKLLQDIKTSVGKWIGIIPSTVEEFIVDASVFPNHSRQEDVIEEDEIEEICENINNSDNRDTDSDDDLIRHRFVDLAPKSWTNAEINEFVGMLETGVGTAAIKQVYGISTNRYHYLRKIFTKN